MKKFEKILISIVLLLSILSIGIMNLQSENEKKLIVIKVDNEVIKKIELTKKNEHNIYPFQFKNNTGYLEIQNGKARMKEMSKEICPKSICSETGWIAKSNQSIVCLPNKITVTIQDTNSDYDFII